ncbi:glutathione S-transferase family protein [Ketobacter sp.]|uniref:glutathione S-transferase family protein n=1 Tax=Ketobacter sp. TaxID=2083498 RepID=UPI000F16F269|nr:glutathione S-transferase [Ketobacter sp.]RLT96323.1 MAG: glutathione S-transferase [Ketobacter sp.]
MSSLVLYQFPISHFCEKARWALDYKGLDYTTKNLLPGLHVKTTKKLAAKSSVPVLVHEGRSIQGSEQIITYLDEHFPDKKLTPVNSQEAQSAREWERYLDKEIGVHLRCYLYHTLLDHPDMVIGFFAKDGPFWAKPFLKVMFPKLTRTMRKLMDINEATAAKSRQAVLMALERTNDAVDENKYLVGNRFSRADLTAAALLAPLFMPPQYGLDWPATLPEPLQSEVKAMEPYLVWAKEIYRKHR